VVASAVAAGSSFREAIEGDPFWQDGCDIYGL
jgi:hypothetical protein